MRGKEVVRPLVEDRRPNASRALTRRQWCLLVGGGVAGATGFGIYELLKAFRPKGQITAKVKDAFPNFQSFAELQKKPSVRLTQNCSAWHEDAQHFGRAETLAAGITLELLWDAGAPSIDGLTRQILTSDGNGGSYNISTDLNQPCFEYISEGK